MTPQRHPYEVRTQQDPNERWMVTAGALDAPLIMVGPYFDRRAAAHFVAAHLTYALQQVGVQVAPVVTIPNAAPLLLGIQVEIENEQALIDDSRSTDVSAAEWLYIETLRSVGIDEHDAMALDANQALAVADAVYMQLATIEDLFDPGDLDAYPCSPEQMQVYGRALQDAGYPPVGLSPVDEDAGFAVLIAAESMPHPYQVRRYGLHQAWADKMEDVTRIVGRMRQGLGVAT